MTQEEKELLLKDLCSRLPYGIKASYYGAEEECETWDEIEGITLDGYVDIGQYNLPIESIKPYLFLLSSMTEEQKEELNKLSQEEIDIIEYVVNNPAPDNIGFPVITHYMVDWCNKNHFDYRGLIPLGLANDAANLNIY